MPSPMFSVIIPAYNMERYIGECLGSLDYQTCRDFETVIVDDGSTDDTSRIIDDWVAKNECSHVVHKENEGPLLARCCGISSSVGTYIVFLDADDCLEPECLEACRRVITEYSPDIVSFDFFSDRLTRRPMAKHGLPRGGLYTNDEMHVVREAVVGGEYNELCGKAFRRSLFLKDGTDYRTGYHRILLGEDWLQLLPVVDPADSFFTSRRPCITTDTTSPHRRMFTGLNRLMICMSCYPVSLPTRIHGAVGVPPYPEAPP